MMNEALRGRKLECGRKEPGIMCNWHGTCPMGDYAPSILHIILMHTFTWAVYSQKTNKPGLRT